MKIDLDKVDLDKIEAIARAADKDNPGIRYNADHIDGYPSADSAMALFNAMDPATTLSLIRRIRQLGQLLDGQLGRGPSALRDALEQGVVRYGSMDPVTDHWDIDRPADPPPSTQIIEIEGVYTRVPVPRESNGFTVLASSDPTAPVTDVDLGALLQPKIAVSPGTTPELDPAAVAPPSAETTVEAVMDEMRATQRCGFPAPRVMISGGTAPRTSTITED